MHDDPVRNPFMAPKGMEESGVGGRKPLAPYARTGQIITFALVQSQVIIGAIFLYINLNNNPAAPVGFFPAGAGEMIFPGIAILVTLFACAAAIIVPRLIHANAANRFRSSGQQVELPIQDDVIMSGPMQDLLQSSQSATIVGQAILEGAAMLSLVMILIDGRLLYVVPAVICLIGIVLKTPTVGKLQQTIASAVGSA